MIDTSKIRSVFSSLFVMGIFSACAHGPAIMTASPRVLAASAEVKSREDNNGNTHIVMTVKHLAPPEKVSPDATIFVVWAKGDAGNAQAINIGGMKVDKDLNGEFQASTPFKSFTVFVTAEKSTDVAQPTSEPLLTAKVSN